MPKSTKKRYPFQTYGRTDPTYRKLRFQIPTQIFLCSATTLYTWEIRPYARHYVSYASMWVKLKPHMRSKYFCQIVRICYVWMVAYLFFFISDGKQWFFGFFYLQKQTIRSVAVYCALEKWVKMSLLFAYLFYWCQEIPYTPSIFWGVSFPPPFPLWRQ